MFRKVLFSLGLVLICRLVSAGDVLVLETGKTLKAQSYVVEGSSIRVFLNDRAEMVIPVEWVKSIRNDPDPPPAPVPEVVAQVMEPDPALQSQYGDLIQVMARKHEMDWKLVAAVMRAESNFNPRARSPKGAQGLMQLMPDTARLYQVTDPYDPVQNIDAGVRHLKMLVGRYGGKLDLAIAAYNSGEKNVDRYRGIPPFRETRTYVQRVLGYLQGLSS